MKTRLITGLFLLCIFIPVIFLGGPYFFGCIGAIGLLMCYEFFLMGRISLLSTRAILGFMLVLPLYFIYYTHPSLIDHPFLLILYLVILILGCIELYLKKLVFFIHFIPFRLLFFIGLLLPFLGFIRLEQNGLIFCLFFLSLIWVTDSSAYFIGKLFGKTKLSSISPKKTWEGSIGGLIIAILFSFCFFPFLSLPLLPFLFLVLLTCVLSQLSDLHQSLTKRHFNVKDSSQLLPGHGGFYDRCDSYLLAAPFFYYFIFY